MPEGVRIALQSVVAAALGYGLWRTWLSFAAEGPARVRLVAAAGFLARALGGIGLFWTSYLTLDLGRGLQLGGGLWFFAQDAGLYIDVASRAVSGGLGSIVTLSGTTPSVVFVYVLAVLFTAAGRVASTGVLLGCGSFLLTCLALARWGRTLDGRQAAVVPFAVAAVSLSPSGILWATQPLKDAFFVLLVVVWFWQSARWHATAWRGVASTSGSALLLALTLYGIGGIRTYFAIILLSGFGAGVLFDAVSNRSRGVLGRLFGGLALCFVLSQALVASGRAYLPPSLRWLDLGRTDRARAGRTLTQDMAKARRGFVRTGGATAVQPVVPPRPPAAAESPAGVAGDPQDVRPDASRVRAFAIGLCSIFLPRFAGQALGIFEIGGGRGFWAFAEIDTLFLLGIIVGSVALTAREIRHGRRVSCAAVQVLVSALLITTALAYVVTNFGTLFRLREMVFICFVVLPLAASMHLGANAGPAAVEPPRTGGDREPAPGAYGSGESRPS